MKKIWAEKGVRVFLTVWFGQFLSSLGTSLSGFAIGVWAYQQTNSVTQYALISFFVMLPGSLASPFIGPLIDRWDRRKAMILSDIGAAGGTMIIVTLLYFDQLEVWHIYLAVSFSSVFNSFRWPAYSAATTLLVPKEHLGRASGMIQSSNAGAFVIAPVLAGFLMEIIGFFGIVLINFVSFAFALGALLAVRFPEPKLSEENKKKRGSLWKEAGYGWEYIAQRPGLVAFIALFAVCNFLLGMVSVLVKPLVLASFSPSDLGIVLSCGGGGMLLGSVVVSVWGGPKRKILGVLSFLALQGFFVALAGLKVYLPLMALAAFGFYFSLSISNAAAQVLWQCKVAPEIQGRVFAIRRAILTFVMPIAYLVSGPLADYVFEPMLQGDGLLVHSIGYFLGVGAGRGIALLFVIMGALTILTTIFGALYPHLRFLEKRLPDAIS